MSETTVVTFYNRQHWIVIPEKRESKVILVVLLGFLLGGTLGTMAQSKTSQREAKIGWSSGSLW